jgi:AsmA protein
LDGQVSAAAALDVRQKHPQTDLTLKVEGVQAGPLLRELLKKDFLEGVMQADVKLRSTGDRPDLIKANLSGSGELLFNDGAVKGIDLPGMVRNVKAAFGLAEKGGRRPRTDFSELRSRFSIANGVVNNPETSVKSPVLRVKAGGKADLVQEKLDFRVEPTFVATLKGQGDTLERSGIMVPVLVGGTFSAPKFRPDLEGIIKQGLGKELPDTKALQKSLKETVEKEKERLQKDLEKGLQELLPKKKIPSEGGGEKGSAEAAEETVKGLLKKLPFGKQ